MLVGDPDGGLGGGVLVSGPQKVEMAKGMFKASFGRVIEERSCLVAGDLVTSLQQIDGPSPVLPCASYASLSVRGALVWVVSAVFDFRVIGDVVGVKIRMSNEHVGERVRCPDMPELLEKENAETRRNGFK